MRGKHEGGEERVRKERRGRSRDVEGEKGKTSASEVEIPGDDA